MADIPSAARRLAALARQHGDRPGYATMRDLAELLPVLDAVAAGRGDEGRVERWARAIAAAAAGRLGHDNWPEWMDEARAAIALANAERAAGSAEAWRAYEEARGAYTTACNRMGGAEPPDLGAAWDGQQAAGSALDAAVRRLAGMV